MGKMKMLHYSMKEQDQWNDQDWYQYHCDQQTEDQQDAQQQMEEQQGGE
jgi:hypothetical protein